MKQLAHRFMGPFLVAAALAGVVVSPAAAIAAEPAVKVLLENDKVKVTETTFKPGDETTSVARPNRVVITQKGGTLTRVYPDGKTEKLTSKAGQVRYFDATPPYIVKNEGKSAVVLMGVALK